MVIKKVFKPICFLIIFIFLFICCESVLCEKWLFESGEGETNRYESFYKLEPDTLDYIVLGVSNSYYSISPMLIYAKEGYTGYDLGGPGQTIELSYVWLREACEYQAPKYAVFDVSSLFYNEDNKYRSNVIKGLTYMKPSLQKVKAAYECKLTGMSVMELSSPMYAFHERWKGLEEKDFDVKGRYYPNKGTFLTFLQRNDASGEEGNDKNYLVFGNDSFVIEKRNISRKNKIVFNKMYSFCKERGITLIPVRCPTMQWGALEMDTIRDFLLNYDLTFLDISGDKQNIDWKLDTHDSGGHVNYWGNCKTSDYLSEYFCKEQRLTDHRGEAGYELWNVDLADYRKYEEESLMTNEEKILTYFQILEKNKEDLCILFSVKDEMCSNWKQELQNYMERMGLSSDFFNEIQNSYIGIVDGGEVVLDSFSGYPMKADLKIKINNGGQSSVQIKSGGFLYGNMSEIYVDDVDYSLNKRGLNITVIDKNEGKVISSSSMDTWSSEWEFVEKIWDEELWEQCRERGEQLLEDGVYVVSSAGDRGYSLENLEENEVAWLLEVRYVGSGLYEICNADSGEYLTVENFGNIPETDVTLEEYTGLSNQKWYIYENGDNQYTILSHYNRLIIEAVERESEVKFQMNENGNEDWQQFLFKKVAVS